MRRALLCRRLSTRLLSQISLELGTRGEAATHTVFSCHHAVASPFSASLLLCFTAPPAVIYDLQHAPPSIPDHSLGWAVNFPDMIISVITAAAH